MLGDPAGQQAADFVLVQGAADDDDGAPGFGHGLDVRRLRGGVHLVPGFSVPVKALDPQDPAVEGIGEEPGGFLKQGAALQGEVQEGQGLEGRLGAGNGLDIIRGMVPAVHQGGKIRGRQGIPVFDQQLALRGLPGADGLLGEMHMTDGALDVLRAGRLHLAEEDAAGAGGLRGEEEVLLGREVPVGFGIHDGDDAAELVLAVEGRLLQGVEELVHVKDAGGLDDDPVIAAHGHGDQAGTEAAAVAVGAAAAGKGLELAVFAPQAVQEGEIDVHGAVVVDQDAELLPLRQEIPRIAQEEGGFPGAEEAGYEIDFHGHCPYLPPGTQAGLRKL